MEKFEWSMIEYALYLCVLWININYNVKWIHMQKFDVYMIKNIFDVLAFPFEKLAFDKSQW